MILSVTFHSVVAMMIGKKRLGNGNFAGRARFISDEGRGKSRQGMINKTASHSSWRKSKIETEKRRNLHGRTE